MYICIYVCNTRVLVNPFFPRRSKLTPLLSRLAQTRLLCLMPDNFTLQERTSEWERVKHIYKIYSIHYYKHIYECMAGNYVI